MPRVELPQLHDGRNLKVELIKLVNMIKRRFNLVGQLGTDIASTNALILPGDGDYYHLTGSVQVDCIEWVLLGNGDPVEFYFDNGLTLTHGAVGVPETTYSLKLAGGANAVMAAGSKIRLRRDDTLKVFVEMWRGVP